jgi:hypothetical protein
MIFGIIGELVSNVTIGSNVVAKAGNGGYSLSNFALYFGVTNDVIKCQRNPIVHIPNQG